MESEDRRSRETRQNRDRLFADGSQTDRLSWLQGDAVDDDPRLAPSEHAIAEVARPLACSTAQEEQVALGQALLDGQLQSRFPIGHDAQADRLRHPVLGRASASRVELAS